MDKQHILNEIRRAAEANNGIPLGENRFLRETGIKQSDWYGIFWVRWSDAVREAGFAPNRMQTAYADEFLIEKFISLIRELEHFPVAAEVRLKARRDPEFPSRNPFMRFGSKKQFASKIVEYCQQHGSYDDVIESCALVLSSEEMHAKDYERSSEPELIGTVYLLKSGRYYKIGKTNAMGRRERELAIQLPEKPKTIHVIKTDDPSGIEAYWHRRFASKRKEGEWFELDSADVQAFKRRKFM